MSRVAGLANTIRNSGARLGPLDAVFALSDYAGGKQEGEDDVRAVAGAAGSTLGGWGGALAGGQAGATIGAFGGPVGVAVGGALGAIAGGMGGGFLSGWGADRVDELVRGDAGLKKQQDNKGDKSMGRKYFDENGNYIGEDDGSVGDFLQNNTTGAVATGTAAYGAKKLVDTFAQNEPYKAYQTAVNSGVPAMDAAKAVGSDLISSPFMRNAGKIIKPLAIGTGLSAVDDLLLGGGIKRTIGNAFGGAVDYATGGRTNLDGNRNDAAVKAAERQQRYQQTAGLAESDAELAQIRNDPTQRYIDERSEKMLRQQQENEQKLFNRDRKAALEQSRYSLSAQNSRDIMSAWSDSARNVSAV